MNYVLDICLSIPKGIARPRGVCWERLRDPLELTTYNRFTINPALILCKRIWEGEYDSKRPHLSDNRIQCTDSSVRHTYGIFIIWYGKTKSVVLSYPSLSPDFRSLSLQKTWKKELSFSCNGPYAKSCVHRIIRAMTNADIQNSQVLFEEPRMINGG